MVQRLLERLRQCGLAAAVQPAEGEDETFLPARYIQGITIGQMLEAWDRVGDQGAPAAPAEKFDQLCQALERIDDEVRRSPAANRLVKDL